MLAQGMAFLRYQRFRIVEFSSVYLKRGQNDRLERKKGGIIWSCLSLSGPKPSSADNGNVLISPGCMPTVCSSIPGGTLKTISNYWLIGKRPSQSIEGRLETFVAKSASEDSSGIKSLTSPSIARTELMTVSRSKVVNPLCSRTKPTSLSQACAKSRTSLRMMVDSIGQCSHVRNTLGTRNAPSWGLGLPAAQQEP